jgi:hypothetical protein
MSDSPKFSVFEPSTIPKPGDQHRASVRAEQEKFQKAFGDFKPRHVQQFWVGPSPKGEWVGMVFDLEDGSQAKVALPYTLWQVFGNEYLLAMMTAAERIELAYGSAKGAS